MESGTFAADSVTRLLERLAYRVNAALHAHDEESIHKLRVAIRRFAQSLALFKSLYEAKARKKIRSRLNRLMDLTSEIRDCDVALDLLRNSGLQGSAPFEAQISARRKEAVRLLMPALHGWAARHTTSRWRAALTPNGGRHVPLSETVRDRVPRAAKKFLAEGGRASSATDLHRARIAGKKLRYSLELIRPAYGSAVDAAIEGAKEAQTLLGKIHDCHATRALVEDLGGDAEVESWLKKRQRKRTREFHDSWNRAADALRESIRALKRPARTPVAPAARTTHARARTA